MKQFLKKTKLVLSKADHFGLPIKLNFKRQETYSSWAGIFASFVLWVLMLFFIVNLTQAVFDRSQPNVVSKTNKNNNDFTYELTDKDLFIAFEVYDKDANHIANVPGQNIFEARLTYYQYDAEKGSYEITQIPVIPCKHANLEPDQKADLRNSILNEGYCVDKSLANQLTQKEKVPIFWGQFDRLDYDSAFLYFQFLQCHQPEGGCAPQSVIDSTLDGGFIYYSLSSFYIDQELPGYPFIPFIELIKENIYIDKTTVKQHYMTATYFKDTINYFEVSPTVNTYTALTVENSQEYVQLRDDNDPYIAYVLFQSGFQLSRFHKTYSRNYNSLLDMLGNLAGVYSVLTIVLRLLVAPVNQLSLRLSCIKNQFQYKPDGDQQTEQRMLTSQLDKSLASPQPSLRFSQYLQMLFFGKKVDPTSKAIEQIEDSLDIYKLYRKLLEVENLKQLLLNEDQRILFNYIQKPLISEASTVVRSKTKIRPLDLGTVTTLTDAQQEFQQAFRSYQQLMNNDIPVNANLLRLLDPQIYRDIYHFIIPSPTRKPLLDNGHKHKRLADSEGNGQPFETEHDAQDEKQ